MPTRKHKLIAISTNSPRPLFFSPFQKLPQLHPPLKRPYLIAPAPCNTSNMNNDSTCGDIKSPRQGGHHVAPHFYVCLTCKHKSWTSVGPFYHHLCSPQHLSAALERVPGRVGNMILPLPKFLLWGEEMNQRTIVVTNLKDKPLNAGSLLQHFSKFGLVTEYVADPQGQFAVVQYFHSCCTNKVMSSVNYCRVSGGNIRMRPKETVSLIEWCVLLDLDGFYDQVVDQSFFIAHLEAELLFQDDVNLRLCRILGLEKEDSLPFQLFVNTRKHIFDFLNTVLLPSYPDMRLNVVDVEDLVVMLELEQMNQDKNRSQLEMYMDPFGGGESNHNFRHHHAPRYQRAIKRIQLILLKVVASGEMSAPGSGLVHSSKHGGRGGKKVPLVELGKDGEESRVEQVISNTPPLDSVSFHHYDSGLKCKINFDDHTRPAFACLLRLFIQIDPVVLPMLRFVLYLARLHRLLQTHEVSQILTVMVLVYLMKINVLPSVKALKKMDAYNNSFCTDLPTIRTHLRKNGKPAYAPPWLQNMKNTGGLEEWKMTTLFIHEILSISRDFFAELAWIRLDQYAVSLYHGDIVQMSRSPHFPPRPFAEECALYVQHPFQLGRNLATSFDSVLVGRMQIVFRESCGRIHAYLKDDKKGSQLFPDVLDILRWQPSSRPVPTVLIQDSGTSNSNKNSSSPQAIRSSKTKESQSSKTETKDVEV